MHHTVDEPRLRPSAAASACAARGMVNPERRLAS